MKNILIVCIVVLGIYSCKDDPIEVKTGSIQFAIDYNVDGGLLQFDTLKYMNAAGNKYSVTHLEYYVSNVTFNRADGSSHTSGSVFYINAKKASSNSIFIDKIPRGNYTSISFLIGLDSITNKTDALPNILDNINMSWPDAMGGGYHFMKLEGYFLDKTGMQQNGYAMHLGKNKNLVTVQINSPLTISEVTLNKILSMNINEWYKNPEVYDFETDGNYSMGLVTAMLKLSKNGKDVFGIK